MISIIINKQCYIAKFSIHDKGQIMAFGKCTMGETRKIHMV